MAAYAVAVSLSKTLSQLKNDPNYPYPQITVLLKGVESLKCFLVDNREVKREFETEIRDAIYEAQAMIDSHVYISRQSFREELERLTQRINLIVEKATSEELTHLTLDRKISNSVWKKSGEIKRRIKHVLVGRSEDIYQLMYRLMRGSAGLEVVPIVGIAGIGKTALAEIIFDNHEINTHFGIQAWVKVPNEYRKREVLLDVLRSIRKLDSGIIQKTEEELVGEIYNLLRKKRYLVALDNVRDIAVWNDLKEIFVEYHNGSRVLMTTRDMAHVPLTAGAPHLLNRVRDNDSLSLLESIVFDGRLCPKELLVIAEAITKRCRGLPLAIYIVGRLLRCAKLSVKYWEIVLSSIKTCNNYGNLIEALVSLTYKHLPQQLKLFILYMAMFPYDYGIYGLTLVDLCIAEGFIEKNEANTNSRAEMDSAVECYEECHNRNLVSYIVKPEHDMETVYIKEEVLHDFVVKKAVEEKFFFVVNKDMDSLQEDHITYDQHRRLFIRKSIVPFVIPGNYSSASISTVNSLLYYGPEQQYPLSAWLDLKFLKVLDALKIRFYQLTPEILHSIRFTTYLALSYNRQLPAEVCKFRFLQFLIVARCLSVKHSGAPSYLPTEIWDMKELRHLQVVGSDIPDIPSDTNPNLENLLKLAGVSVHSCSRRTLERIPNLVDLEIRIESLPEDEPLSFFSHLHILRKLVLFKCVFLYPSIESQAFPSSIPSFPSTLVHLTLGGCGFPWEYMSVIAALPNLGRLKLQNYAFQGPEWLVKKDEFPSLCILLLEDLDLKKWKLADESCFPNMADFTVRHCYRLQSIPYAIGRIPTLERLEVVDCSTSAMDSAFRIREETYAHGNPNSVYFGLFSSRDD